jgi:hypothetical protein
LSSDWQGNNYWQAYQPTDSEVDGTDRYCPVIWTKPANSCLYCFTTPGGLCLRTSLFWWTLAALARIHMRLLYWRQILTWTTLEVGLVYSTRVSACSFVIVLLPMTDPSVG